MARPYSEKYLLELNKLNPDRLGVRLAKLCVKANLPMLYVADVFNISRMSVHNWFRGRAIRDKNASKVERFIELVQRDLDADVLPAITFKQAKQYLSQKINEKI